MYNKKIKNRNCCVEIKNTATKVAESKYGEILNAWIENYDTAHLTSKKVNKFEIMDQVDDDEHKTYSHNFLCLSEKNIATQYTKARWQ